MFKEKMYLDYKSFFIKIKKSFFYALSFCSPILCGALLLALDEMWKNGFFKNLYLILNSFLAPFALVIFLSIPRQIRFHFGFLIGLFLFYWISFSFIYAPLPFLLPLVMIIIALIYGIIFWLLLWSENIFLRALMLFTLSFIHPFSFDWLNVEFFFAYSIFGVDKISFICLIISAMILCTYKDLKRLWTIPLLVIAISKTTFISTNTIPLDIQLTSTKTAQNNKWDHNFLQNVLQQNFALIHQAILNSKDVIILPETAFSLILNQNSFLLKKLEELSQSITIITGALSIQDTKIFNSTYIFEKGHIQILNKVILAPFGEKIPLPHFLAKPLHQLFFGTEEFLHSAPKPQNFNIANIQFRNAICYEGTSKLLYADHPKYVIMMSNNAWFFPSIEPYFQQILLKFYARKNNTLIFHSANFSQAKLITPSLFTKIHIKR